MQVSMHLNNSVHVRLIFDISSCGRFLWYGFPVSTADALLVFSVGLIRWVNTLHPLPKGLYHGFLTYYQVSNTICVVYPCDQHIAQYLECTITLRVHGKSPVDKHKTNTLFMINSAK